METLFNNQTSTKPDDATSSMRPLLLVDNGGCTQIEKVKNAEDAGIKGVILIQESGADYINLRRGQHLTKENAEMEHKISIPYFRIEGQDGNTLKK